MVVMVEETTGEQSVQATNIFGFLIEMEGSRMKKIGKNRFIDGFIYRVGVVFTRKYEVARDVLQLLYTNTTI